MFSGPQYHLSLGENGTGKDIGVIVQWYFSILDTFSLHPSVMHKPAHVVVP